MRARLLAVLLLLVAVALSQEAPAAAPSPAPAGPQETRLQLPDGTALQLALVNTVSTQDAKVGHAVEFRVVKPVTSGGLVVIAEGARAKGSVVDAQPPGRKWKAGKLAFKAESAQTVRGEWVPLRASAARTQGASRQNEVTHEMFEVVDWTRGLGIPLLPLFALQKGRHAMFMAGSVFSAFLDGGISADEQAVRAAQPPPPPVRTGPAVLTVYHLDGLGSHLPDVFIGNERIAWLDDGQSFQISLPPGTYWIRLRERKTSKRLEIEEGGRYFVRVRATGSDNKYGTGRPLDALEVQEPVAGALGAVVSKPVKPGRVKELAKTKPEKLTADPR
ncbi:MAG: hypothetical protein ACRD2K_02840 [Terriglobales bacterium]